MLAFIDGALFLAALYCLGFMRDCTNCASYGATHLALYQALLLTTAFVAITASVGLYNRDSLLDFSVFIRRFILASQLVFIPAVGTVAIAKAMTAGPFGWYVGILSVDIAVFFAILLVLRCLFVWSTDRTFLKRRVLVIGHGEEANAVVTFISNHGGRHLHCIGQLRNGRIASNQSVGNLALLPYREEQPAPLALIARSQRAEEIVIAVSDRRGLPMWQLLECRLQGIQVTDYLQFWERETGQLDLASVGPGWLALSDGFRMSWSRRAVKRALDIAVSLAFLVAVLPVCALVALCIKLEGPGPIFYRQERVGKDGKTFSIWKFRSMRSDAEKDGVPRWAAEKDTRVTRVGGVIRKLRIDEFPQVFNVLKGDMSFIGPRPERPYFVKQLRKDIPLYDLRHRVQPGITGWAQVNYHYAASIDDTERKLAYDLYYVKNQDTVLDLIILMQTVRVFLFSHGSR